jgi:hypothetical protein
MTTRHIGTSDNIFGKIEYMYDYTWKYEHELYTWLEEHTGLEP